MSKLYSNLRTKKTFVKFVILFHVVLIFLMQLFISIPWNKLLQQLKVWIIQKLSMVMISMSEEVINLVEEDHLVREVLMLGEVEEDLILNVVEDLEEVVVEVAD